MKKLYFTEEERKAAKKISAKKYYSTENGKSKKTEYDRQYRIKQRSRIHEKQVLRRQSKEGYADRFMERIKLKTPDTDITREWLLSIFANSCCISSQSFEYTKTYNSFHNAMAPSIDRVNSKRGYYKDNVQIILACLNRMKNDMPNDQFLELWKALTDGK